jgi:nitroimidazol reductase NimA-like FMN-containing flavoprotein (pyridoxamine 5'-phosphate oxidase superfamily)
MLGNLNEHQMNNLLSSQVIGRLACSAGNQPYLVPLTYTYDGTYIYGQTKEGMKLDVLRKNPNVCFEVDVMTDMANWQSVIVQGIFEELTGEEAEKARHILYNRVFPMKTSSTVHSHEHYVESEIADVNRIKPVVYRIGVKEKTGRFEKR